MYSSFTQKNRQIVQRLSKKLDPDLHQSTNKQDFIQHRGLDEKYKDLLQRLKIFKTKNERQQLQISHQLEKVQDVLFSLQRTKNKNNDIQNQAYQSFQKLVQSQQNQNTEKMAAVRKGMIEDIDRKKKTMKTDAIQIIEAEFQQMCKTNLTDIQKKLEVVTSMLEEQRQNNEQSAAYLAQTIGQQILKMQQQIGQQKQQRKKSNNKILEFISQVEEKIDAQIKQQSKIRQKQQDHVQSKLQQICYKIEAKILGHS